MFEDICLLCGKPVDEEGRAYCSDECETTDVNSNTSPSISSQSSTYPSPHFPYNPALHLPDVPPLVPDALGAAFHSRTRARQRTKGHTRNSLSSSSTSSVYLSTSSEDLDETLELEGDRSDVQIYSDGVPNPDLLAVIPDVRSSATISTAADAVAPASKGAPPPSSLNRYYNVAGIRSAFNYARRPSATNTRSTIPMLHKRTSSGSTSASSAQSQSQSQSQSAAQSAPSTPALYTHTPTDEDVSDAGSSVPSRRSREHTLTLATLKAAPSTIVSTDTVTKAHRSHAAKRSRASLPAYFSLLQMPSTAGSASTNLSAGTSTSVGSTGSMTLSIHRAPSTPPTPRIPSAIVSLTASMILAPPTTSSTSKSPSATQTQRAVEATPRGRRHRSPTHGHGQSALETDMEMELDVDEWAHAQRRGRPTMRRNSSPPLVAAGAGGASSWARNIAAFARGSGGTGAEEVHRRGRRKAEEVDRPGMGMGMGGGIMFGGHGSDAPGFGSGRSGLVDRDRSRGGAGTGVVGIGMGVNGKASRGC